MLKTDKIFSDRTVHGEWFIIKKGTV